MTKSKEPQKRQSFSVELRQTFDDRHYYLLKKEDGEEVPLVRVTTITSGASKTSDHLTHWREEQVEKIGVLGARINLLLAAHAGTKVHNAIEMYLKNKKPLHWRNEDSEIDNYTDHEWKCICRFDKWYHEKKPKVLFTEKKVFNENQGYMGTLDAIVEIDGKIYVCDWKTSKSVQTTHRLQVAAYVRAAEEMNILDGRKIYGAIILALGSKNKCGYSQIIIERGDIENLYHRFIRLMLCFHDEVGHDFQPKRDLLPVSVSP